MATDFTVSRLVILSAKARQSFRGAAPVDVYKGKGKIRQAYNACDELARMMGVDPCPRITELRPRRG